MTSLVDILNVAKMTGLMVEVNVVKMAVLVVMNVVKITGLVLMVISQNGGFVGCVKLTKTTA